MKRLLEERDRNHSRSQEHINKRPLTECKKSLTELKQKLFSNHQLNLSIPLLELERSNERNLQIKEQITEQELSNNEKSITELEQILFPHFQINLPVDVPELKQERQKALEQINFSYKLGLDYYQTCQFELAEKEFVKVLKPVLSKSLMRNGNVNVKDAKEQLLDAMYHLGQIYLVDEECQNHYSKAAAIFQYCAGFAKKYSINKVTHFLYHAYIAEVSFLNHISKTNITSNINDFDNYLKVLTDYKKQLGYIRMTVGMRLAEISNLSIEHIADRAKAVEQIYEDCTNFFVNNHSNKKQKPGLIQKLFKDCFQQLGPVPEGCKYTIIGLGSLSGGKMTPWSDLEFAILINEDIQEFREYFRNLTKLLHLKIINFGETPLRFNGIESLNNFRSGKSEDDWFWDDVLESGFSFDGPDWHACKTPLGRQGGYRAVKKVRIGNGAEEKLLVAKPDYELILTPKQMAEFQKNNVEKKQVSWFNSDKHLVQALKSVSLIDGSKSLLEHYRQEARRAETKKIIKQRALKILKEDIDSFALKLGSKEEGKLINIKKDIFRLSDRIIEALANYYSIEVDVGKPGLTAWGIIDKMAQSQILSEKGAQHLKEALSISTELRLATYYNNNCQKEGFSTYQPVVTHLSENSKKQLLEETFYERNTYLLHHFYYVMLRMQKIIKLFCSKEHNALAKVMLKNDQLLVNDTYSTGMVNARFLEYDKALKNMKSSKKGYFDELVFLKDLFSLYRTTGSVEEALNAANKIRILELKKAGYKAHQNLPDIACSYNNLGLTYADMGNCEEAIKCYKQALLIWSIVYKNNFKHYEIAASYNNLGSAYNDKGEHNKAIKYHRQSITIWFKLYNENPHHQDIAISYNNLGLAYASFKKYNEAIKCYNLALIIWPKAYKDTPNHPDIAAIYNNLGLLYASMQDYKRELKYHKYALTVWLKIYENTPYHLDIVKSFNNLGVAFKHNIEYDQAIKNYRKALTVIYKEYNFKNLPDIAGIIYHNLGEVYEVKGNFKLSIKYFELELAVWLKIYENTNNHPYISISFANLGYAYLHTGNYEQTNFYARKGLMYCSNSQNDPHILKLQDLYSLTSIYLANQAVMKNNVENSKINFAYKNLHAADFTLGSYLEAMDAFFAAINCQKALIQLDPKLIYGNYYQNLAYLYTHVGNIVEANNAFNQALNNNYAKASGELHAQYAQFLIQNKVTLNICPSVITQHIYQAINSENYDCQAYNEITEKIICNDQQKSIDRANTLIKTSPQAFGYYLLLKHQEYESKSSNINSRSALDFLREYIIKYYKGDYSLFVNSLKDSSDNLYQLLKQDHNYSHELLNSLSGSFTRLVEEQTDREVYFGGDYNEWSKEPT